MIFEMYFKIWLLYLQSMLLSKWTKWVRNNFRKFQLNSHHKRTDNLFNRYKIHSTTELLHTFYIGNINNNHPFVDIEFTSLLCLESVWISQEGSFTNFTLFVYGNLFSNRSSTWWHFCNCSHTLSKLQKASAELHRNMQGTVWQENTSFMPSHWHRLL